MGQISMKILCLPGSLLSANQQSVSLTSGTPYTISLWYAPGSSDRLGIRVRNNAGAVESGVAGSIGALSVSSAAAGAITVISDAQIGVYRRAVISFTPNFSGSCAIGFGPDTDTLGGDVVLLGAQIEQGAAATSYIHTNGVAAIRASDTASVELAAGSYDVRTVTQSGTVDALGVVHGGGAYWPAAAVGRVRSVHIYRAGSYTPLLPSNATALERALEALAVQMLALDVPVDSLWSPARCPAALLPYLAWALSVDEWDAGWSEGRQREVIAAALEIQRHKGTPWAIKRTLAVLGYGNATLVERYGARPRNGSVPRNGSEVYAPADHWAEYRVILDRPITIEQAARVRKVLATVAPARCTLKALDYVRALNIYDGTVVRNGTYTRGVA